MYWNDNLMTLISLQQQKKLCFGCSLCDSVLVRSAVCPIQAVFLSATPPSMYTCIYAYMYMYVCNSFIVQPYTEKNECYFELSVSLIAREGIILHMPTIKLCEYKHNVPKSKLASKGLIECYFYILFFLRFVTE